MSIKVELSEILAMHAPLDEKCLEAVRGSVELLRVPKRSILMRQGEVCRYFYFNRSGITRVVHDSDGIEDTICFGTGGDVFTSLQSYYEGAPSIFSLTTVTESEVWTLSYEEMDRLSERFPSLVLWMRNLLLGQVITFERRYLFFGKNDAETRYINFINQRNSLLRDIPVKYVAQYLKIAPEYLSRIRRRIAGK